MENVWVLAALGVGLASIAALLAIWFKISTALTEIVAGTIAQLIIIGAFAIHGGGTVIAPRLIFSPFTYRTLVFAVVSVVVVAVLPFLTPRFFQRYGEVSGLEANHNIINERQYSRLVATVIGSAVVPAVAANAFFMPRHLPTYKREAELRGIAPEAFGSPVEAD